MGVFKWVVLACVVMYMSGYRLAVNLGLWTVAHSAWKGFFIRPLTEGQTARGNSISLCSLQCLATTALNRWGLPASVVTEMTETLDVHLLHIWSISIQFVWAWKWTVFSPLCSSLKMQTLKECIVKQAVRIPQSFIWKDKLPTWKHFFCLLWIYRSLFLLCCAPFFQSHCCWSHLWV